MNLNVAFRTALIFFLLSAFFGFAQDAKSANFLQDLWVILFQIALIAAVTGAIMEIWKKKVTHLKISPTKTIICICNTPTILVYLGKFHSNDN